MKIRRYQNAAQLRMGMYYGTSDAASRVYHACLAGIIDFKVHTLAEGERLDILAGKEYGDGRMWWVIAAASGIGWGMQVPPGTFIRIPEDLNQIAGVV